MGTVGSRSSRSVVRLKGWSKPAAAAGISAEPGRAPGTFWTPCINALRASLPKAFGGSGWSKRTNEFFAPSWLSKAAKGLAAMLSAPGYAPTRRRCFAMPGLRRKCSTAAADGGRCRRGGSNDSPVLDRTRSPSVEPSVRRASLTTMHVGADDCPASARRLDAAGLRACGVDALRRRPAREGRSFCCGQPAQLFVCPCQPAAFEINLPPCAHVAARLLVQRLLQTCIELRALGVHRPRVDGLGLRDLALVLLDSHLAAEPVVLALVERVRGLHVLVLILPRPIGAALLAASGTLVNSGEDPQSKRRVRRPTSRPFDRSYLGTWGSGAPAGVSEVQPSPGPASRPGVEPPGAASGSGTYALRAASTRSARLRRRCWPGLGPRPVAVAPRTVDITPADPARAGAAPGSAIMALCALRLSSELAARLPSGAGG